MSATAVRIGRAIRKRDSLGRLHRFWSQAFPRGVAGATRLHTNTRSPIDRAKAGSLACAMLRRTVVFGLVLSAWACSDPTTASPPPAMTPVDAGFSDAAPGAMDAHVADAGPPVAEVCRDLGLEPLAMRDGDTTYAFGDVAGDFTVNTLYAGPWTLSENWTGCESYVFVAFIPTSGRFEEQLWASRSEVLVEETDPNAHFFFVSSEGTAADREDRVAQILGYIDSFIDFSFADPDERARQRRRFHYVTDAPDQITGSVGRFFADYLAYARDRNNAVDLGERGMAPPPLPSAPHTGLTV